MDKDTKVILFLEYSYQFDDLSRGVGPSRGDYWKKPSSTQSGRSRFKDFQRGKMTHFKLINVSKKYIAIPLKNAEEILTV